MSVDIREFIAARLDEDEAIAREAASTRSGKPGGHWKVGCNCASPCSDDCDEERVEGDNITIYAEGGHDNWQAQHIARWDPARVLAESAVKRAILANHPPLPDYTDAELHTYSMHPEWEYETSEGQRKAWDRINEPPPGDGWERNTDKGRDGWERLDYTEESYWRRRLPPEQVRGRSEPRELRLLAAIDADHPDFDPSWKLETP